VKKGPWLGYAHTTLHVHPTAEQGWLEILKPTGKHLLLLLLLLGWGVVLLPLSLQVFS